MLILNVSTSIITSITAPPAELDGILSIMYVSTFIADVILYSWKIYQTFFDLLLRQQLLSSTLIYLWLFLLYENRERMLSFAKLEDMKRRNEKKQIEEQTIHWPTEKKQKTNSDLHNITRSDTNPLKPSGELKCSRSVYNSCSTRALCHSAFK